MKGPRGETVGPLLSERPLQMSFPVRKSRGYIDFDDFIPFFVLFTVPQLAAKNVRKLKYVLHAAVPIQLSYQDGRTIRRRSEIPGQLD